MNMRYDRYNDPDFWEAQLAGQNIWQGVFSPQEETRFPLFINSVIRDKSRGLFSCDWASYPSAHALLGFFAVRVHAHSLLLPLKPRADSPAHAHGHHRSLGGDFAGVWP